MNICFKCAGLSLPFCFAISVNAQVLEEVHVTAHPLSAEGLAQPAAVLQGAELERRMAASIGETVARQPGIHSSSFGKAVGRPVIHGLSGARVKITEDRIDTLDVSTTSGDHASTVEPFLADQIEILKGASTLLYGSGAIGGVVDVHTGRIPHGLSGKALSGRAEVRADNNADTQLGAARLDGVVGDFAWHVDGFNRDANPYEIPTAAESDRQLAAEGEDEAKTTETLAGSQLQTHGGAIGGSWIAPWGFFGVAVSRLESDYGLPGGHEHEQGAGGTDDENPQLELKQNRVDLEFAVNEPFAGIEKLNLRVGANDYEHSEIEPSGEVATRFENDAWEARLEFLHAPLAGWAGAFGVQLGQREFSAIGEEAFTPPVDTDNAGLFWVAERNFRRLQVEGGVRAETVRHSPKSGSTRRFTSANASMGVVANLSERVDMRAQLDYSGRAPTGEELFSNGPHLATSSFEVGDSDLDQETALNVAITLSRDATDWWFEATAYLTDFGDYIFLRATGQEQDDLPVFQYSQQDARFHGLDVSAGFVIGQWGDVSLSADVLFDSVRARLSGAGGQSLSRIPATRYGFGVEMQWADLIARVDFTHVRDQMRVGIQELPTDGWNDLALYLGWNISFGEAEATVFLQGKNVTNKEQRHHTSFIKDFAPAPGRTIEAGLRLSF